MSKHTNRDLLVSPNYTHRYVGGRIPPINKQSYLRTQMDLIKQSNRKLPPNIPTTSSNKFNQFGNTSMDNRITTRKGVYIKPDRYDPYNGFLYERGLLDDGTNKRRYKTIYIDINSAFRVKQPFTETEEAILLTLNPLDFKKDSNLIFVQQEGHEFQEGENITLTGVVTKPVILRTFFQPDITGPSTAKVPSFEIPAGCNFMKIFIKHEIPSDYTGDEIKIQIEGIKGDRGTIETSSFLGNIPTNVINSKFPIKLTLSSSDIDPNCDTSGLPGDFFDFSPNYFFVILPKIMHDPPNEPPFILRDYNYKIISLSLAGIPLNLLNAEFPINQDRRQGFHVIKTVRTNGYFIEVNVNAVIDDNGGGSNVFVSKITSVETGFPNPNSYTIDLGRTLHNLLSARLISMEFPNTEQVVKSEEGRANNKIYWNDLDDGDNLYIIEVPPGNYTPSQLSNVLEALFFDTPRINSGTSIGATYTPNHFIQVNIDTATDIVTFRSFKEFILVEPIDLVTPEISQDAALDNNPPETQFVLTIRHPGHGMTAAGERILITGAISHLGIPISALNAEHIVIEVIDDNNFKIQLPRINLSTTREDTKGGVSVTIFIPDIFRFRFDRPDTMGELLGFRNPGDQNSITPFTRVITNKDPYDFDINQNSIGETIEITNNSIRLSGDDYVIMVAKPLETFVSIGPIKSAFAKIILCDTPGNVIFNSFVPTSRFYDDTLHELSQLEISFFSPDGNLFNFNGLDHSFTLELVVVQDIPEGTGVSANTGRNYGVDVPRERQL